MIKKINWNSQSESKRFLRFIFVGVINTIFGYSIYWLLLRLNLHFTISLLIASIIGILFNFHTTGKFVFANTEQQLLKKFFYVYLLLYIINVASIKMLCILNISPSIAGAIALVPNAVIAFILQKKMVFRI